MPSPRLQHLIGRAGERCIVPGQRGGDHGQFMRVGADGLQIAVHGKEDVRRADEAVAQPFLQRLDTPALPQEAVPPPGAEVREDEIGQQLQPLHLLPQPGLGARIEDVEREPALVAHGRARFQFVEDGERGNLPHRRVRPWTLEAEFILTVHLAQPIVGQAEIGEPGNEFRAEHLLPPIEAVAGQPYQLLFGEADLPRMVELGAQLLLVDDVGETDRAGAVDDGECRLHIRMNVPDHLEHEELVEIRVEQAADDRVEPEIMVVGACRDVSDGHAAILRAMRVRPRRAGGQLPSVMQSCRADRPAKDQAGAPHSPPPAPIP